MLASRISNYFKALLLYMRIPFAMSNGEKQRLLKKIRLLLI